MQIDGLGRAVRTAKTGFVNGTLGWNASGAVEYDKKGREVKKGVTEFIQGDFEKLLNTTPEMTELFTQYEYDEKDRAVKTTLPDSYTIFQNSEFKNQSTLSSWWSKKSGEILTNEESKLQRGIGIGEMIAGPTLGTIGCVQTGGQSIVFGYYIMADGAVMISQADKGIKATPGIFLLNLLSPISGDINGIPVMAEYNSSPLPVSKYS